MPVLPVPLIIALVLAGLFLHRLLTKSTPWPVLALIGLCAVQSSLTALVHYYGLTSLRVLQPITATIIPAICWLAFRQATVGPLRWPEMIWHAAGPVTALICLVVFPGGLDVLIPLVFAAYGAAMLGRLRRGEDALTHSRLESGRLPLTVWRFLALALIASAVSDVIIAVRLAEGDRDLLLWLPSLFSATALIILGTLGLWHAIDSQSPPGDREALSDEDKAQHGAVLDSLDSYISRHAPHLDPDLTLARLARKLRVPEKRLSAAINQSTGENVSRYINGYRIRHACTLLQEGTSVTQAMLASGFNTKSNFNREFLRVTGQAPRDWIKRASPQRG
ncbi:AraC family transcriptional regulator [uncultured Roseobacter sp.]|uniref:helix-turn-helix domain-containing protein n=1 Tax=uncultured Roseobacter sp. TaxID=114847 RepID=UPI0026341ADD|nr:AraC family transcriptional regulator [uncultured Roseobacter sp.]